MLTLFCRFLCNYLYSKTECGEVVTHITLCTCVLIHKEEVIYPELSPLLSYFCWLITNNYDNKI